MNTEKNRMKLDEKILTKDERVVSDNRKLLRMGHFLYQVQPTA